MSWLRDLFYYEDKKDVLEACKSRSETERKLRKIKNRRVVKKFDDETADYIYVMQVYKNYGDLFSTLFDESGNVFKWRDTDYYGDIKWAKKISNHYGCKIVEEEL